MSYAVLGGGEVFVDEQGDGVRPMLMKCRRELLRELQSSVRDAREIGSNYHHHRMDLREPAEAEPQDDLMFALIQMKADTLVTVNEAVGRFDEGMYGRCIDCGETIASSRLLAMPFAVRCRECQAEREDEQYRERIRLERTPSELGSR
jgi:DnaK suppressor protein